MGDGSFSALRNSSEFGTNVVANGSNSLNVTGIYPGILGARIEINSTYSPHKVNILKQSQ